MAEAASRFGDVPRALDRQTIGRSAVRVLVHRLDIIRSTKSSTQREFLPAKRLTMQTLGGDSCRKRIYWKIVRSGT